MVAALVLSACTGTASPPETTEPSDGQHRDRPSFRDYVALGDSYTAAPYVPTTDLAAGCLRSDGNYPSLLARRLDVEKFNDVSCSAADIGDLFQPQRTYRAARVPAQLDALTTRTDLVTVGIGGNDFDLFGNLLATCARLRDSDPRGAPCTEQLVRDGVRPVRQVAAIGRRLVGALREIGERAPQARVVLVGYPRIASRQRSCPRLLPLAEGDYTTADRIARLLRSAMRTAAGRAGVEFVDMYAASRGHDVCSERPWVNGRFTDQLAALAFHPFDDAMRAATREILAQIS